MCLELSSATRAACLLFVEVASTVRTRQLKCCVRILANVQLGLSDLGSVIVAEKSVAAGWRSIETASQAPTPVAL